MTSRAGLICGIGLAGSLLAVPGARLWAQQATRPPAFRSAVDVIAVDVNVVDRNGQPVRGLTPEQFEVTVDGKPRPVVSADFLDYETAETAQPAPRPLAAKTLRVEANYSSNEKETAPAGPPARVVVLAVDQLSFSPGSGRAAVESAKKFLDRLQPADRAGLVAYPSPGPVVAPTVDHQVVREALGHVVGMADTTQPVQPYISMAEALEIDRGDSTVRQQVIERECGSLGGVSDSGYSALEACTRRIDSAFPMLVSKLEAQAKRSINGLQSAMNAFGGIEGPKTLVIVSAGLVPGGSAHLDVRAEINAVAAAAAATNTRIYVLHLAASVMEAFSAEQRNAPATVFQDATLLASGLQLLAGMSAGTLLTVTAGADSAFDRVAKESSAAYMLALGAEPEDRDGKSHKIQVRVRVPNTTVRSRTEFVIPAATPAPRTPADAVAAALKPGRLARDLPMRMTALTMRDPASGQMRVLISANIGRGVAGPADVQVGYTIVDQTGREVGTAVDGMRLKPRGTGPDASWSYVNSIVLRAGVYTIRLAAVDAEGRAGSVEYRLETRLTPGEGVALSDVVFFDPLRAAGQGWATLVDGRVAGPAMEIYVEMYPVRGQGLSSVSFDIADQPDGQPLVGVRAKPTSNEGGRRWSASAELDVNLLPPGDYVAVATVFNEDKKLGRVSKPFRLDPPSTAAVGAPRAAFSVAESGGLVRSFTRQDALTPDALQYFLNRLQEADAENPPPALATASASLRSGKFDEAMSALADAGSDRLSVPFLKGLALYGKGQLEPAAAQFRDALRISSEFLPAAFYLGACYAAGGRDREAAGAWQTSLVSESEARIVYDVLADALLRLGDGAQAEAIIREAIERWPGDDGFMPRLAGAQVMQRQLSEALDTLDPYLARNPADAAAIFLAMRVLYDAHAAGGTVKGAAEDAARAARYSAAYKAAAGPRVALVDRWAAFVQQGRAG